MLVRRGSICYNICHGVLAQLVERYTGSVEVSGSNPLCSTRERGAVLPHLFFVCRLLYAIMAC